MTNFTSKWNYPTTIRFGAGRIAELPEVLKEVGIAATARPQHHS